MSRKRDYEIHESATSEFPAATHHLPSHFSQRRPMAKETDEIPSDSIKLTYQFLAVADTL